MGELLWCLPAGTGLKLFRSPGPADGFLKDPVYLQQVIFLKIQAQTGNKVILQLQGIHTHEEAEKICGLYIGLELAKAKQQYADPGDPYLFQYIDEPVQDHEDSSFHGTISGILDSAAGQWLLIELPDSTVPLLVPLQRSYIPLPLPAAGTRIHIHGLKDLAQA